MRADRLIVKTAMAAVKFPRWSSNTAATKPATRMLPIRNRRTGRLATHTSIIARHSPLKQARRLATDTAAQTRTLRLANTTNLATFIAVPAQFVPLAATAQTTTRDPVATGIGTPSPTVRTHTNRATRWAAIDERGIMRTGKTIITTWVSRCPTIIARTGGCKSLAKVGKLAHSGSSYRRHHSLHRSPNHFATVEFASK